MRWFAGTGLLLSGTAASAQVTENRDPGFQRLGAEEIVASIPAPDPSGIAVVGGRLFLTFPKHDGDHPGPVLSEWNDGRATPFPSARWAEAATCDPAERLICPHGLTLDTRGRLWVIDDGKIKGQPIPPGGAKVVGIDPSSGKVFANVVLKDALLRGSHMNDLRVDLTHGEGGTAYISDSSFDGHPALVVVDIATGWQRRVLANDKSVKADPGFLTSLGGRPLRGDPRHPPFPYSGVDGVTLRATGSITRRSAATGSTACRPPCSPISRRTMRRSPARSSTKATTVRRTGSPPMHGAASTPTLPNTTRCSAAISTAASTSSPAIPASSGRTASRMIAASMSLSASGPGCRRFMTGRTSENHLSSSPARRYGRPVETAYPAKD